MREGSFFNPKFPAPSGGRPILQIRIFDTINGALAKAMPHRAMGAFSHWSNPNIGGIDDRTGKPFVMYDVSLAGYGGQQGKDGAEGLSPVMNCSNIPVEVHETHSPIRVHRFGFIPDTGGAGQWRGGCGIRKDIELLNSTAVLSHLGDRHVFAPYGIFGGKPGALAESILNPEGNGEKLHSKETREIKQGDVLSFRLSGAGGYGPPEQRDPSAIARDIADGYVTREAAKRDYGAAKLPKVSGAIGEAVLRRDVARFGAIRLTPECTYVCEGPSLRSLATVCTLAPMSGRRSTRRRKSSASRTSRSVGRTAVTVAERGSRDSSAISPKKLPSSSRTLPAGRFHLDPAAGDQVHGVAALALADDGRAGRHRARAQDADEVGDRGRVEAREQRHAGDHGEGHDEVAAADFLVEAAADDGDGQREAADTQHDRDRGDDAAERRHGR